MLQNKLASSFSDSLNEECKKLATDAAELSLDSLLKDSALKDIPFISTAVSLYNIGVSIKDIHNIKKLAIFLEDLNKKILNTSDLEKYKARFKSNKKASEKELEYLLVILDRYVEYEKPKLLSEIYFAYLNKEINFNQLQAYSVVIDRLFPLDIPILKKADKGPIEISERNESQILRLSALGLLSQKESHDIIPSLSNSDFTIPVIKDNPAYIQTKFGKVFSSIIQGG